jgi:DNA-directed RNA polymerase subunit RPC12/RpoP
MEVPRNVVQVDRVRCLDCGATYTKPGDGGTVNENPGCPRCGYLGWIPARVPRPANEPRRSAGDLPLRPGDLPR